MLAELRRATDVPAVMELAFEAVSEAIVWCDAFGIVRWANAAFVRLVDHPLLDVVGKPLQQFLAFEIGGEPLADHLYPHVLVMGQRSWVFDAYGAVVRGERRMFEVSGAHVAVHDDAFAVLTIRDITDREAFIRDLRLARDAAEGANRAKSAFLANVSHEIRTPINGILGMLHLLADTELTHVQRRYVETIQNSSDSLMTVINDVLDFAKVEAGKLDLEIIDFSVQHLVDDTVRLLSARAKEKNLALTAVAHSSVPRRVKGDPTRLRQVLSNLVGNAVKFTQQGRVIVRVSAAGENLDGVVLRFEIEDSGIGISPEAQRRLFEPFFQADSSMNRRYGGTGLGLSISKRLVEAIGGEIGVTSVTGQGSTFWFTAHFGRADDRQPSGVLARHEHAERRSGADARVLLVEDHPVNQEVCAALLQSLGCRVDIANNGLEGVDASGRGTYDAILMDCQMPEMDGYEATRRIREREVGGRRTPIIAMTAHAIAGERERCLEVGMDDYLSKPMRPDDLSRTLLRWVAGTKPEVSSLPPSRRAPSAGPAVPVFDRTGLLERVAGNTALAERLVAVFVKTAGKHIETLHAATGGGDAAAAEREAHALKGAAASVGALRVMQLAQECELAGARGDVREVAELLAPLAAAFEEFGCCGRRKGG